MQHRRALSAIRFGTMIVAPSMLCLEIRYFVFPKRGVVRSAHKHDDGPDVQRAKTTISITKAFGDGYDGVLNGKHVAFPCKNAASIRARLAALGL